MQATVLEDVSLMSCYRFRVRFENGIEDIYTIIEGPENYVEATERGNEHYANALIIDLYELSKIAAEKFLSILTTNLNGEQVNVWLMEEDPDPGEKDCVMVNYNTHSGFQLYRANENEPWKYREYKPTPLTEEEKVMANGLCQTMQTMYNPLQLDNVISSGE
jgi:hypothetical protein